MEDNYQNRQASARKRGRPSLAELAARTEPAAPIAATVPNPTPTLPPLQGFLCTGCGRGQVPRVYSVNGLVRYVTCGSCGCKLRMIYTKQGELETVQRL